MRKLEIIHDFYKKQKEFSYLQSISLNRNIDDKNSSEYLIKIVLSKSSFEEDEKLLLNFYGSRNIRIGSLEGLMRLFITINDITENQWENLRFKVKEDENDQFSFYCYDFDIVITKSD